MSREQTQADAVRNLQTYLRQLSYHDPTITPPPVDGILDTDTQQAIRDFQVSRQLPPTGIVDQLLWELLYAAYRASLAEQSPPRRMEVFPILPQNAVLSIGNEGFPVTAVQFILQELEGNYGALLPIEMTGRYTENTADAVRAFQEQNGLASNGIVDRVTWNEMVDQYNIFFTRFPIE